MNAEDLTALVERARATEPPTPPPPGDLLVRGRAAARRRTATILGVGLSVVLVVAASVGTVSSHGRSDAAGGPAGPANTAAPTGTRLVGAHGVVVRVPAGWTTDLEQGSYCNPTSPRTVQFFLPLPGAPIGSCSSRIGASVPSEDTLTIATGTLLDADQAPAGAAPTGTVSGMAYYLTDAAHGGPGVARRLVVPEAAVEFTVGAATRLAADAILSTVEATPTGTTTVELTTPRGRFQPPVLDVDPARPLSSTVVETDEYAGYGPGYLVRTDPPLGTPVPVGSTVTLVTSTGDLDGVVAPASLVAQGWDVSPAQRFDPPIGRQDAAGQVEGDPTHPGGTYGIFIGGDRGVYLRQLDQTLVWIVARREHQAATVRLTAVDARTGAVLRADDFPAAPR